MCEGDLSLAVSSFVSNFNSRKSKQTLPVFDLSYKSTSKINKLKHYDNPV